MCTVTYIPAEDGYILTVNRDELPERSPKDLTRLICKHPLTFPLDPKGGSWIALDYQGRSACLINGASKPHQRRPSYIQSRGLLVLHYFNYHTAYEFIAQQDFDGYEPFTLLLIEKDLIVQLMYDGAKLSHQEVDHQIAQLWGSRMLYSEEVIRKKARRFKQWISDKDQIRSEDAAEYHRGGGENDIDHGMILHNNELVKTVSVTQISVQDAVQSMDYWELQKGLHDHVNL